MANLRLRVELNKGQQGIPLEKLHNITKGMLDFLIAFTKDIGVDIEKDTRKWIALNFENNSVDFDCQNPAVVDKETIDKGNSGFAYFFEKNPIKNTDELNFRNETYTKFNNILNKVDNNEKIRFGTYRNGDKHPNQWYELSGKTAPKVECLEYLGEIQGFLCAFNKEKQPNKIIIKDCVYKQSIDCFFKPELYEKAAQPFFNKEGTVIFVAGRIFEDLKTGKIRKIKATHFTLAPKFDQDLYNRNIGRHPNLTGGKSTQEYLDEIREW